MQKHQFIFMPGRWIGEGKITFNTSRDHLRFYTNWAIEAPNEDQQIICQQRVEIQGSGDNVNNQFSISGVSEGKFKIILENDLLGWIEGHGIVDFNTIAWEFRNSALVEGFEVYELQENGDYMLHAEYSSPDQFRTIIDGRIWRK